MMTRHFIKPRRRTICFLNDINYICGHNIIHHDAKYLFANDTCHWILVDTLYISPLLFPERPYHRLVKDDKLICEQMNNPVNDCKKAKDLLLDEIACWNLLSKKKRVLFASLLKDKKEFEGFLSMVSAEYIHKGIPELIKRIFMPERFVNMPILTCSSTNIHADWHTH